MLALIVGTPFLPAYEKGAIAQKADLVVVARLTDVWCFPWVDGWHIRGTLEVTRVLWGPVKSGDSLDYRFVCKGCPFWPSPSIESFRNIEGLWFVNRLTRTASEPNSTQIGDLGFRYMRDIHYFEEALSDRSAGAP